MCCSVQLCTFIRTVGKSTFKHSCRRSSALLLMLFKSFFIPFFIYIIASFFGKLSCKFKWKTKSVIQSKNCLSRNNIFNSFTFLSSKLFVLFNSVQDLVKFFMSFFKSLWKLFNFFWKFFFNLLSVCFDVAVVFPMLVNIKVNNIIEVSSIKTDISCTIYGSTDKSTQNVSLSNIWRKHTICISQNKHWRTQVVCDNSVRTSCKFAVFITNFCFGSNKINNCFENTCIINTLQAIQNNNCPFKPHSCINVWSVKKFCFFTSIFNFVLHENIVPNFKIFPTITSWRTIFTALWFSRIIKHFTIWSTRSNSTTECPPVVITTLIENIFNSALFPSVVSKFVTRSSFISCKNCCCQSFFWNTQIFWTCQKFIRKFYHFFFWTTSQKPVPKHFKRSQVTSITNWINIICS